MRETRTATQIRNEVRQRIHEPDAIRASGVRIDVAMPAPCAQGEKGPNGSNWTLPFPEGASGYEGWAAHVVRVVQSEFDMALDDLESAAYAKASPSQA